MYVAVKLVAKREKPKTKTRTEAVGKTKWRGSRDLQVLEMSCVVRIACKKIELEETQEEAGLTSGGP